MAKLFFRYGAMNCGKSTALLQVAHNYEERGMRALLIKPAIDLKGDMQVISRIGAQRQVDLLAQEDDQLFDLISATKAQDPTIKCILVDEAQFLPDHHIDQLMEVTLTLNIPVICYGLRSDFLTHIFPGSARLFAIAHSIEELKTICRCGRKAIHNARMVNGAYTTEGGQVAIDGIGTVTYESLCGHCYQELVGPIASA